MSQTSPLRTLVALAACLLAACGTDAPPSSTNNETNNLACTDACGLGDRTCLDDGTLETCRRGTEGCFEIVTVECLATEICADGDCQDKPKTCEDACTPPASRCNILGETETCADHDSDGCVEFGGNRACDDGKFCDQADGLCKSPSCTDACVATETECQEGLLSTCSADVQGCLVWGPGKECGEGLVCQWDACVPAVTCEDECSTDATLCTAEGELRSCGNYDDDTCLEFSPAATCPNNQTCRNGECVAVVTCQDQCIAGEKVCVGNDIASCGTQPDGCLAFGTPTACPGANESCSNATGVATCTAPPVTGAVVINELFYDALGADDFRSGAAPTFLELSGPPGLDIAGYKVELINGSGGSVYATATLPTDARLDGNGFAVLAIEDSDSFLKFAAPGNKYFILPNLAGQDAFQNGPDNVKLYDASNTVVDALGYGAFATASIFEGEGMAAPASGPGRSLGRVKGVDTHNNASDFVSFYPTPGMPNADLIINEVYFDQPGTDTGTETFVEVIAPIQGWEDIPLDGYVLRAVNGLNGMDYIYTLDANNTPTLNGIDFSGTNLNDGADGLVVVCNIDTAAPALLALCTVPFEGTDFQNGPDNFVLEYRGRVIDAVGYGTFTAPAVFVGEGTPKAFSSSGAGKSLSRWPISDPSKDNDTDDNSVDFHLNTPSPAQDNPIPN